MLSVLKSKAVRQTGRQILDKGLETGVNVLNDTLSGESLKTAVDKNLSTAKKEIAETLKTAVRKNLKRKTDNINEDRVATKSRRKKIPRKSVKFAPRAYRKNKRAYSLFDDDEIGQ